MSSPKTRRRTFGESVIAGGGALRSVNRYGELSSPAKPSVEKTVTGTQVTVSAGHPWPPKGITGDVGGPFTTTKSYIKSPGQRSVHLDETVDGYRNVFDGVLTSTILYGGPVPFPPARYHDDSSLDKIGATAIAQCAPGNPPADAATFLGELFHDGIPSIIGHTLWRDRTLKAKQAGDEYLNAQFGWAPMVSDIKSFAKALTHADSVLNQYERDAGRVVRRHWKLPRVRSVETTQTSTGFTGVGWNGFKNGKDPVCTRIRTTEVDTWFSGAFTYYLPSDYDSRNTVKGLASQAKHLLGLEPTPSTLWELTPWSWAVDWFTNTGDVIKNLQRFGSGGLVMSYGYVMEHSIITDTYAWSETGLKGQASKMPPVVLVTETKTRRQANPFGFGTTWDSLSKFQLSILGALGLSRSR